VHLVVRIRCRRRDEAQRSAAFGVQRGALGGRVEGVVARLGAERLEPRPQRIEDRMG